MATRTQGVVYKYQLDKSTQTYIEKANKKISSYIRNIANEPSLGLFFVQNHVKLSIPRFVEMKKEVKKKTAASEAVQVDLNFSHTVVKGIGEMKTFISIKSLLEDSIKIATLLSQRDKKQILGSSKLPFIPTVASVPEQKKRNN